MVGYSYGFLLYVNLTRELHKTRTYGESALQMTAKEFQKWASKPDAKVVDMNRLECKFE